MLHLTLIFINSLLQFKDERLTGQQIIHLLSVIELFSHAEIFAGMNYNGILTSFFFNDSGFLVFASTT